MLTLADFLAGRGQAPVVNTRRPISADKASYADGCQRRTESWPSGRSNSRPLGLRLIDIWRGPPVPLPYIGGSVGSVVEDFAGVRIDRETGILSASWRRR